MRPTSQGSEGHTRMTIAQCLAPGDTDADVGTYGEVTAQRPARVSTLRMSFLDPLKQGGFNPCPLSFLP